MFGGIDLGGTKIEACLFDDTLARVTTQRVPTPRRSYPDLLDALIDQHRWLCEAAGQSDLPLGIGIPGLIDPTSGLSLTSNLPAMGMPLRADLSRRLGFEVPVKNDCKCFALSEANGGAGASFETVFGLILGTGCGGGVCYRGTLVEGSSGLPGEVGHTGISIAAASGKSLPLIRCNCGRVGCYETLVSGPGMVALARSLENVDLQPEQIVAGAFAGEPALERVLQVWADLVCELLRTIQGTVDPDCVVIGGGLSQIQGIEARLSERLLGHRITGARAPAIRVAAFGDSSGVRGAAMLAVQAQISQRS